MSDKSAERVLVVPTALFHEIGIFQGFSSRVDDYLPRVVAWHLEHRPAASHPAYEGRARERELAARLAAPGRPS